MIGTIKTVFEIVGGGDFRLGLIITLISIKLLIEILNEIFLLIEKIFLGISNFIGYILEKIKK